MAIITYTLNGNLYMTVVFAYYRVSTEKQVDKNTMDNQIIAVAKFADELNLSIIEHFKEPGISGADPKREQYNNMIQRLNEVDGIIVYEFSRLSRDRRLSQRLAWDMEDNGKILYVANDRSVNDFRDMATRMKFSLIGEIADEERRNIKQRQILGIQRVRAANGGIWGRRATKVNWRMYDELKARGLSDHAISKVLDMDWRTLRKNVRTRP